MHPRPAARSGSKKEKGRLIDCAVVGASGYAGAELVSILGGHPRVNIASAQADGSAGRNWEDLYPGRAHLFRGRLQPFDPDTFARAMFGDAMFQTETVEAA